MNKKKLNKSSSGWRKEILAGTDKRARKRPGRGIAAGRGKTAGRGTKGQKARGRVARVGFEGGQTPLHSRLPKMSGMPTKFKKYQVKTLTLTMLSRVFADGARVDLKAVRKAGLVGKREKAKIVNSGKLTKNLKVFLPYSKSLRKIFQAKPVRKSALAKSKGKSGSPPKKN